MINKVIKVNLQCLHATCQIDPEVYATRHDPKIYPHNQGVRALRGYFGPPMRPKNEICFSPNSSYWFIRTITQVYKSDISLTFTVAMVTKMAAKTGLK